MQSKLHQCHGGPRFLLPKLSPLILSSSGDANSLTHIPVCSRDVLAHEFEVVCSVHLGLRADSSEFHQLPPKVLTLYLSPAESPQTEAALALFLCFCFL